MWYVGFKNNPKYGWRPKRFKWIATLTPFRTALELHNAGWKDIHITTKRLRRPRRNAQRI